MWINAYSYLLLTFQTDRLSFSLLMGGSSYVLNSKLLLVLHIADILFIRGLYFYFGVCVSSHKKIQNFHAVTCDQIFLSGLSFCTSLEKPSPTSMRDSAVSSSAARSSYLGIWYMYFCMMWDKPSISSIPTDCHLSQHLELPVLSLW